MDQTGVFEVAGFTFNSNFDSGNLAHVQLSPDEGDSDLEGGLSSPRSAPVPVSRPSTSTAQLRRNVMRSVEVLINSKTAFEMEEIYLNLVPTSSKGKKNVCCIKFNIR